MTDDQIDFSKEWDVLVIGSGIGGATVARHIAQQGLEVLVLEKGKRVSAAIDQDEYTSPEDRMARGWWPMPVSQKKGFVQGMDIFLSAIWLKNGRQS